jgi:broad specificity phosphatase PhoE
MLNAWQRGHLQAKIEGGESAADLEARLRIFISHLENRPERHLLICSHGRAMRGLMCLLDGQPITAMNEYGHSNTGLYHIRYQEKEGYQFVLRNDTSHLAALTPEVK